MSSDQEKNKLIMDYVALVGEQTLKENELRRIQSELNLTPEEILAKGKELTLASFEKKD